jgi:peptidoglycan/LPS O-acetylase OafA/YrhL
MARVLVNADAARHRNLDALRAVGALAVLGMHANALLAIAHPAAVDGLTVIRFGLWSGVNLFFALSGYLISQPFVRALLDGSALPQTRAYLLRRAARILPAYWVALVVLALVTQSATDGAGATVHALLLQDLVPGHSRAMFPIAWSLGIEAMFYVAVPLIAAAIRSRRPGPVAARTLLAGVGLVWLVSSGFCIAAQVMLHGADPAWLDLVEISLAGTLFLFCPGVLAAVAEGARRRDPGALPLYQAVSRRAPVLAVAAVAGWVLQVLLLDTSTLAGRVMQDQCLTLLCGMALMAALHAGRRTSRAAALLAPVGTVSYGIYLWHWVIGVAWVMWIGHIQLDAGSGHIAWLCVAAALAGAAVVAGAASWLLVERPAIRRAAQAVAAPSNLVVGPAGATGP